MRQREMRKRVMTMKEPTRIPMMTQRWRPKIEVRFESCVLKKDSS